MRWKQIVGWLELGLLLFSASYAQAQKYGLRAPEYGPFAPSAIGVQDQQASARTKTEQGPPPGPTSLIRRVAILRMPPSTETRVLDAVDRERAMGTKRRHRPPLYAPQAPAAKSPAASPKSPKGHPETRDPQDNQEPPDDSSLTVRQLKAIGEILFEDSLIDALHMRLNLQIVPAEEVETALKELGLTVASANSADNAERLSERLQCDAVFIPRLLRLRLREGETRDLAFWASLRVYRSRRLPPNPGRNAAGADYPVSGAGSSERAPFQSQYLKDWTHLIQEAGKKAAAMASQTFLTGVTAPFARESDIVAVLPITSPRHADALIFESAGRRVIPGALAGLPADVSARFHPSLLPLFEDSIPKPDIVRRALAALQLAPSALWTKDEMPDGRTARLLGARLKADYVLMARIGDLEIAEETGRSNRAVSSSLTQDPGARSAGSGGAAGPVRQVSASAEAIGAFVRVSDGALLWHERTTATSTAALASGTSGGDSPAARRAASDAIHFALLQLERRFRQFRSRYER